MENNDSDKEIVTIKVGGDWEMAALLTAFRKAVLCLETAGVKAGDHGCF